jgi:hypothetical protein
VDVSSGDDDASKLTQAEIDRLVARLFDMDPLTLWPASVPAPFSSKNPPHAVRVSSFSDVPIVNTDKSILLVNLGALPRSSY